MVDLPTCRNKASGQWLAQPGNLANKTASCHSTQFRTIYQTLQLLAPDMQAAAIALDLVRVGLIGRKHSMLVLKMT